MGGKNGRILPDVKTANFDFQMIDAPRIDSTLEDICCAAIPDNISDEGLDRLGGTFVITKSVFIRYNLASFVYTFPVNQEFTVTLNV